MKYVVQVTEHHSYRFIVDADSYEEAEEKGKEVYENTEERSLPESIFNVEENIYYCEGTVEDLYEEPCMEGLLQ